MTGHNPTDKSKLGSKRHILTDKYGIPLSVIITSANTHDVTMLQLIQLIAWFIPTK